MNVNNIDILFYYPETTIALLKNVFVCLRQAVLITAVTVNCYFFQDLYISGSVGNFGIESVGKKKCSTFCRYTVCKSAEE